MSLASKIVLATATAVSAGIIGYVHYKQEWDRWDDNIIVFSEFGQLERQFIGKNCAKE